MKEILENGTGEIEEKKSRFIAHVFKIESYEQALIYIEQIKKKYWDARHNCYALTLGEKNEIQRYSDDGEPQGTAGKPMLDILNNMEIGNCLVVVTRYFGGTLLGTGGLIRAYQESVKAGLAASSVVEMMEGTGYSFSVDYNTAGKLQYLAGQNDYHIYSMDYSDVVTFTIIVRDSQKERFEKQMIEITNGNIEYTGKKNVKIGINDGKYVVLE